MGTGFDFQILAPTWLGPSARSFRQPAEPLSGLDPDSNYQTSNFQTWTGNLRRGLPIVPAPLRAASAGFPDRAGARPIPGGAELLGGRERSSPTPLEARS